MKTQLWGVALALSSTVAGFRDHRILRRQSSGLKRPAIPLVPSYNFSMPVDHFNSSDTRTFNNRYFVNDTYYKPGGPVVFYDFGEAGVDTGDAAMILNGWNNATSSVVEVAKALNGLIIGWEHRYYGSSHPFPLIGGDDESETSSSSENSTGIPVGGAAAYQYLTIEQALEDVAYFAKNFNTTKLGVNNTVLSGTNATQGLGPYHTPWIWIGGSYPGSRGAWSRLRNPEVMYAVWSSSAPLQTVPDGSPYFNSVFRAIPKNCSSDMQAVGKYIDKVLLGDDEEAQLAVKVGTGFAAGFSDQYAAKQAEELSPEEINTILFERILATVQSFGISSLVQKFCDHMESFNVDAFLSNSSAQSTNISTSASVFKYNDGRGKPSSQGIIASHSSGGKGLTGEQIGFSALLYGVIEFTADLMAVERNATSGGGVAFSVYEDMHSWEWQVLTELGLVPNFNSSSPLSLGTSFWNLTVARGEDVSLFEDTIDIKNIPDAPNQTFPQSLKGWDMTPTNVMFTNGEFDPWRAFGVMSLDQDLGAPQRKITQDIPKCGEAPSGTDVFGLLYGGAVHAEDIAFIPSNPRGSIADKLPVTQGAELFISAYNAWLPCFNTSRTGPAPGNSPPTNAGARLGSILGAWEMAVVLTACVVSNLF